MAARPTWKGYLKVINLLQFTEADAYSVMREGMQGKAGIGKVAIHGREYLVAVKPHKQGMVMYTLHHAAEIRTIDQIEELREVRGKVNPAEMKLARQVIESIEGAPWTIRRLLAVDDAQVDDLASAPWRSGARS